MRGNKGTVLDFRCDDESTLGAVAMCAAEATAAALAAADVRVLQPLMAVEVTVRPDEVGAIVSDLGSARKASVFGIEMDDDALQTVNAEVPLAGRRTVCFRC